MGTWSVKFRDRAGTIRVREVDAIGFLAAVERARFVIACENAGDAGEVLDVHRIGT